MRIHIYFFCLYTSFLAASDCDWVGYENGLIFRHAITLSLHSLAVGDLQNLCSLSKQAHSVLKTFFTTYRSGKKDLFNKIFALPASTILAIAVDDQIQKDWVNYDLGYSGNYKLIVTVHNHGSRKACIVPDSFLLNPFGTFVYALEVSTDDKKQLSLNRVKFPILPSGDIAYAEKQRVQDEIFSKHAESLNTDHQNKIMCLADTDQQRLVTLLLNTDSKNKKSMLNLFIMEPLKASYHYTYDVNGYPEIYYPSQEDLFKGKGILAYATHSGKPAFFNSYHCDANTKAINNKEHFFILEKPEHTEVLGKQSLGRLTRGLITQVLQWPTADQNGQGANDRSIIHYYDENSSLIPKELIEIYLNDLRNSSQIYEKMKTYDDLKKVRIAQATILLGALNYPKPVNFDHETVLSFLKEMSAMSHAENGIFYRCFDGDEYYKDKETEGSELRPLRSFSSQPLCSDAKNSIDAWVLALDPTNQEENKIKWLADHVKEAMAMQPEDFLNICKNLASSYAKKSWDNGTIAVSWRKERFNDKECLLFLYKPYDFYVGPYYYQSYSIDENDSITNVVYRSEQDVEFYFKKSGKYRSINGQQGLVRCDD